jgi:hypothetical protein
MKFQYSKLVTILLLGFSAACGEFSGSEDVPADGDGGLGLFTGDVHTACGDDVQAAMNEFKLAPQILSESSDSSIQWIWCDVPKPEAYLRARMQISGVDVRSTSDLVVDPQMPSMGHGTYVDEQAVKPLLGSESVFDVSGIYFIMGGDWDIYVTVLTTVGSERFTLPVVVKDGMI